MNIFDKKFIQTIINLNEKTNTQSKVKKVTNTTQRHTSIICTFLYTNGIIDKRRRGREDVITLTAQGLIIKKNYLEILTVLKTLEKNK